MDEFECKRLLSKDEFDAISYCFASEMTKGLQINYYYDTPDMMFNQRGITVRIRQKDDTLTETVKKHQTGTNIFQSSEDCFTVCNLPIVMKYDNAELSLMGQVVTERFVKTFENSLMLMLDKNYYLGHVDYELELEFPENAQIEAVKLVKKIEDMFCDIDELNIQAKRTSKSERFFTRLNQIKVSEINGICIKSNSITEKKQEARFHPQ
jgi:uncharacterized protein YjbK